MSGHFSISLSVSFTLDYQIFDIVTAVNMSEKLQKSAVRSWIISESLPQLELMRLFSLPSMEGGATFANTTSQMRSHVIYRLPAMSMSRMCS